MNKKKIYLLPQFNNQVGYGHLKRLINIYDVLKNKFLLKFLFYDKNPKGFKLPYVIVKNNIEEIIKDGYFLIIDFRYYKKEFIEKVNNKINLLIFDSPILFNPAKYESVYINITTPIKYKRLSLNQFVYNDVSFYPFPAELHKKIRRQKDTVLISFGNSDPNKLTKKMLMIIKNHKNKFLVTIGSFFSKEYVQEIKNIIRTKKNFQIVKQYYRDFLRADKIITSYGLTFIEALILRKKIALLNNSIYHTKLSGFFSNTFFYIGTNKVTFRFLVARRIKTFLNKYDNVSYDIDYTFFKNKFFSIFVPAKFRVITHCSICNSNDIKLILNNKYKQIYECGNCKVKFQNISIDTAAVYNEKYFTDKYKNQYGNTYLEDKENIIKFAVKRLNVIRKLNKNFNSIMDIGCAYGFFLKEAKKYFKTAKGIEINKKAVEYGRKVLFLDIDNVDLMKFKSKNRYDVITLWYVMEHFKTPYRVITKLKTVLNRNGLLCLAIPNGSGALYKFNKKLWFKLHPDDHYFDYTLKSIRFMMRKLGFKLVKYRITGIHPHRAGFHLNGIVVNFLFRILKLGDTMELYFRLVK